MKKEIKAYIVEKYAGSILFYDECAGEPIQYHNSDTVLLYRGLWG